jgi:hypothetical protein
MLKRRRAQSCKLDECVFFIKNFFFVLHLFYFLKDDETYIKYHSVRISWGKKMTTAFCFVYTPAKRDFCNHKIFI